MQSVGTSNLFKKGLSRLGLVKGDDYYGYKIVKLMKIWGMHYWKKNKKENYLKRLGKNGH